MKLFAKIILASGMVLTSAMNTLAEQTPGVSPGPGRHYATDAYPGFDSIDSFLKPEKKEPKWFHFWNGPKMDNAADQLKYCTSLVKDGEFEKAAKELDALVRDWPNSREAVRAQRALADVHLKYTHEYEKAVKEYVYILDFYSFDNDYVYCVNNAYMAAEKMREEGKTLFFLRFANTVDVRRAYEAIVFRAPGAAFVPAAMLTIASLREDEQRYENAISVYENLRNIHPDSPEAKESIILEARLRMKLLSIHEYNRERINDTIKFLRLQLERGDVDSSVRDEIVEMLNKSADHGEHEAYLAAKFYDTPSRTRRSAINAYETFLRKYPASRYAGEVLDRLNAIERMEQLKGNK